jgi:pectinesterase
VIVATAAILALFVLACGEVVEADVHLIVGTPEQGGQYATVQAAVNAVPSSNTERYIIDIMPGTYTERVFVVPDMVTLKGMGATPNDTKLTYFETASTPPNESTVHASTVIRGKDFVAENLTFENSAGQNAGQALAVYARGDRSVFNNCRFLGWQDTLRSESGRHYFYNSYIEGSVDFIYGKGTAYFENSTLHAKKNGYLTAQGRESAAETNGYVFKNSTITGEPTVANGSVFLGRPWQAYSRAVFLDTKMSSIINAAGWQTWSGNNHLTSFFAEYNSMDLNGDPLDVSQRVSWSHQLTAEQAAPFSKENWLGGSDGWNPMIEVVAQLPGDYNDDGRVDAADYTVWRDNHGEASLPFNETASEGIVDQADYDVWKANFGTSSSGAGAAVSVPEPGFAALTLAVACFTRLTGISFRRKF